MRDKMRWMRWAVWGVAAVGLCSAALDPRLPDPREPPRLYANQCRADLRRTLAAAIDRADLSVHVATYTMRAPKIVRALRRASERGVQVVVHIDSKKASGLRKQLGEQVKVVTHKGRGLMHQKLVVIDGHQVWLGTANMTYASLRSFGNLVVAMESEELANVLARTMGEPVRLAQHAYQACGQSIEYWALPGDQEALDRLVAVIDAAQDHVRVAMFTWTHAELTAAVMRAHARGVAVQCVVDRPSGHGASRHAVRTLKEAGVPIALSIGPELLHHKIAWIDDQLVLGSANWTRSAFEKNCDCFVILHRITGAQAATLNRLWRAVWVEANLVEC